MNNMLAARKDEKKTPNSAENNIVEVDLTNQDPIIGDQEEKELALARDNPKLGLMVKNIDILLERTKKAKRELEQMMEISVDLKNQCKLQEDECILLEEQQSKVTLELNDIRKKVDTLEREKILLERKLEELRVENDGLEAFLSQAERMERVA